MSNFKNKNFKQSLKNAFHGLKYTVSHHKHFRFVSLFAFLVFLTIFFFDFNDIEIILILVAIFLVLITEGINTILEEVLDFIDANYNHRIKNIKDALSGMVLLASIFSLLVGFFVFFPRILSIFGF